MRKRIMKLLAGFFIAMLCCTVIARAADSFTIAKVQTEHVKKGRLTVKMEGSGSIRMQEQVFQSLPGEQKVKKITVRTGDWVHAGDKLAELDLDYLKEHTEEQSQIIEKLRLQIEQQTIEGLPVTRIPETAQAEVALQGAERTLDRARESYQQASGAYDVHYAAAAENMTEEEYQTWKLKEGELASERKAASQAAETAMESYTQACENYDLAVRQEEAAQEAEDKKRQAAQIGLESLKVDLDAAQKKKQKLQKVMDSKGIVTAKADGIFASIAAKEGTVTTGSEQIILLTGGLEATGILPEDAAGKVAAGDSIKVTITGNAKPVELVIDRIGQSEITEGEETSAMPAWFAKLDKKDVQPGASLTYQISRNSAEEYEKLIPLGAIRSAQGADYVLAVRVKGGILGDAHTAVKVPVTVLAKDGENAAIDANTALEREDQFIVFSNKYVEEGDRVRLKN